ncbi:MAG: type II toxin-antitoxin system RelE/ParE family toxin [Magnetospirillum sp.]|nr:MAG: type II toxin-antitoxin system RelE/ParE family toxin [Magnetospirillum sp.]
MTWAVEWDERAVKDLHRLDRTVQSTLLRYLRERIATDEDPRRFGKGLSAEMAGLWRYRVGDYRLICSIEDETITVLVLAVGHRRTIYG